jgi:SCY1-like protein 2
MASAMFSNALKSFSSNISSNYYEKSASPVSYCGPWKVFDAKKKKTNQPVSIFVFERRSLDNGSSGSGSALSLRGSSGPKAAQDEVVERLKHEANLLARLRHPCVLELVEPVEETRSGGLQFVTEHVTGSLATLLAEKDGDERSGGTKYVQGDDGRRRRREVEIDELEIQKGLLQIGKALEFLHEQANLIHGNLTPEAVMVNAKVGLPFKLYSQLPIHGWTEISLMFLQSDWKVCGFGFTVPSLNPPLPPNFDPRIPQNVQQQLDYAAPELVLDQSFSPSCDLFSLGVLIVTLYNSPRKSPIESHNSTSAYRRIISSPQTVPNASNNYLSKRLVPRQLTGTVLPQLITRRPTGRMTARDFQQSEYFDNILVSTLRFLDNFPAKTPSEKAAFMRGLPKILPQFPKSVLEKKILPGLVEELRDGSLLALILPNIFLIVESAPARLFSEKVLKRLKNVFILPGGAPATSTSEPRSAAAKITERDRDASKEGGLTVILSKLALIKHKTTAQEFKEDILPLVHLALESPTHALQDLAMRCLPTILPKLDFPTLKNDLFPVVSTVFIKTSSLGIKIRGLEAFRVLCGGIESEDNTSDGLDGFSNKTGKLKSDEAPVLDKYTIQEKVIPLLKGIKTKEPAVMMEALSVFNEIGKVCDREVVAMDILPTLWTMSFGPLLGLEQVDILIFERKIMGKNTDVTE